MQSLIDTLTVTRLMAAFVQRIKAGTFWQYKTLVGHHGFNEFWCITILFFIFIVMILPDIRNVLKEQHGKDKVFIGISTDGATERITRGPQGFVDRVLTDFVVHESSWSEEKPAMKGIAS
ncbi:Uncharacterised protein [Klebsiella pneumoniae]|nr:Uncharacterised protein [Klebsiella pneumoniae]SWY69229.1 Uncharacterised protein [Klebsiella pneumoniae]SYI70036.1 Uncharacterised protein [Klebsiella pneumoniae]